jgi:hypothetical protein
VALLCWPICLETLAPLEQANRRTCLRCKTPSRTGYRLKSRYNYFSIASFTVRLS